MNLWGESISFQESANPYVGFITSEWRRWETHGGGGFSVPVGNVHSPKMLPQCFRDVRVPDLSGVCMQLPKIDTWHPNPTTLSPLFLSFYLSHLFSLPFRISSFDPIPCNCIGFSCSLHVFPPHLFVFLCFFLSFAVGAHFLHFCSMWITVLACGRAIRKGGRQKTRHMAPDRQC